MSEQVEYFDEIDVGDEFEDLEISPSTDDVVRYVNVARMAEAGESL